MTQRKSQPAAGGSARRPSHSDTEADQPTAGGTGARTGGKKFWAVAVAILVLIAAGATFPRWRGPVESILRRALHDPEAQAAAEQARTQALVSASSWQKVADVLPDGQLPLARDWNLAPAEAEEALSAGDRHLETMAYDKAEESFRRASELYESHAATAMQMLREEPSRVAGAARELYDKLEMLEREVYGRLAEQVGRLDGCERSLLAARTDDERQVIEVRRQEAKAELDLMNRLMSLTQTNVFSTTLRAEIRAGLNQADRQLEDARYREALSSYVETKARLEELLAWPEQAESVLRQQAALSREAEQLRSTVGPVALELPGVRSALDDSAAQMAQGDDELAGGQLHEALMLYESARDYLTEAKAQAVRDLLSLAQAYDSEGKTTDAVLALDELFVLDPKHTKARQLREKILSERMTNSIGMELVFIPPGEFMMGSPSDELGRDEDERQRRVRLTSGFYMGATEATQSQWLAVMDDNPSKWKGDDLPVEQVSWEAVMEFCRRLSLTEDRRYRLPTEAEWEYACRAGTTTPFSFGDTIFTDQANYDGEYVNGDETKGVFRNEPTPVRSFPPNAWGLYDMHGNVWEWCPDGYEHYPQDPVLRPAGEAPITGRVLRGGSWRNRPRYCRSANRVRDTKGSSLSNIGFRVVLESD